MWHRHLLIVDSGIYGPLPWICTLADQQGPQQIGLRLERLFEISFLKYQMMGLHAACLLWWTNCNSLTAKPLKTGEGFELLMTNRALDIKIKIRTWLMHIASFLPLSTTRSWWLKLHLLCSQIINFQVDIPDNKGPDSSFMNVFSTSNNAWCIIWEVLTQNYWNPRYLL